MKTRTKWLVGLLALSCVSVIGASATGRIVKAEEEPVAIPTIVDECEYVEGENRVADDVYGYSVTKSDLGFGEDSRFSNRRNSTSAPVAWSDPYAHYNLSGQNVIQVVAAEAPEAKGKLDPVFIYTNKGAVLNVYDMKTETAASTGWSYVTYTYVLEGDLLANTSYIRLVTSAYNDEANGLATWMQTISRVEISYMETLPENPAVLYKKVGTDNCTNNQTEGIRKDVYNIRILNDNVGQIGDMYRMAYGNHGAESYVEYNMNNMDTLVVTAYEPIGENNTRPNATQVRFAVWQDGKCVKWEVEATSTEVVLGDYESGRWTKVVYTYKFDKTYESAVVRLMMYKPTADQAELQIGRVDVYNSKYADLSIMAAKAEIEAYAWTKNPADYTAENWTNLVTVMATAVDSLDGVVNEQAATAVVTKAKADMDAVETIPVPDIPEDSSSEVVDPEDSSSEVVDPEDSSSEEDIVEIPTIVDECEYVEGADRLADDVYGYNVSKSDVGFGEDSRFSNRLSPTSAPKVWEGAYAQYNLGGQNVIRVVAAEAPEAKGKLDPVFIYTNKGAILEVYDVKTETADSTGWSYVTYTYVLEGDLLENTSYIRLVTSAYDDETNGLATWMQQIASVEISYMETLPDKTPETPDVPEDSSSEVVDPEDSSSEEEIVEIPTIVDECEYVEGADRLADDVYGYNVSKSDLGFGEDSRFANRLNSTSAPEAWSNPYAHYNLSGQNVIKVVAAEAPEAKGKLDPVFIYTNKGAVLEVYDMKTETAASTGWSYVTYTYVLEGDLLTNTSYIRLVTSAYNDETNGLATWMQQIASVEISYMETLPEKTPETPDVPEDSSSEEPDVPDVPVVVDPVIDNCDKDTNSVFVDLYGYKLDSGDVGFGEDSRYMLMRAPSEPISKDKIWDSDYAYVQYKVGGHNLLTVVADIPAEVLAKMPHIFVFGCKGNSFPVLELNNYNVEASSNWSRVTYTYIVPEGFEWVRVMAGAYNAWDESVFTWQQQITSIKLEKVDVLPEKDADIPEIQLPPEKPAPEAPDLTIVQSDNCTSIKIEGARKDIYNVSVLSDNMEATADASRMVFGSNAGAQESYIDYTMNYMDTIAVTTFEPILADGSRPENTTKIRFSIWLNGKVSKWEVDATSTEVVLGDAVGGRWTKVVWYYKLESAIENASIRVMIYKPTEGQVEVQIGRVDIYNSQYANFFRMDAQAEIEEYAYQQNKQDYSESNWLNVLSAMIVAKEAIDSAADESEANAIVLAAKAEIDAVKTFADEFEDRKEDKKMELSDFAVNKGKQNYTSEAWNLIVSYVLAAQDKIDKAATEDEVRAIVNETKELINAVEQLKPQTPPVDDSSSEDEEEDEEDEEDNNPAGGLDLSSCFSGIEGAGMMLVVLVGSVVAMLGKKKEDNE